MHSCMYKRKQGHEFEVCSKFCKTMSCSIFLIVVSLYSNVSRNWNCSNRLFAIRCKQLMHGDNDRIDGCHNDIFSTRLVSPLSFPTFLVTIATFTASLSPLKLSYISSFIKKIFQMLFIVFKN